MLKFHALPPASRGRVSFLKSPKNGRTSVSKGIPTPATLGHYRRMKVRYRENKLDRKNHPFSPHGPTIAPEV